jgi:hypothetical protein
LLDRINFPKVFTVLASTLGLSFGACGLTLLANLNGSRANTLIAIETGLFLLSAAGLVLTFILWVIARIIDSFTT